MTVWNGFVFIGVNEFPLPPATHLQGLRTSYQCPVAFSPEMQGEVENVARKRSVLGRIFDQVRGAVER